MSYNKRLLFKRLFSTIKYSNVEFERSPRRALLYLPASKERFIKKAATEINADCLCLDLEDGVATNKKELGRQNIVEALAQYKWKPEMLVRINPLGSGFEHDDLNAVLSGTHLPDSIVLPKVETAEHVQWLSYMINHYRHLWSHKYNKPAKSITITALIESGRAIVNLKDITESDPLLNCMIFGGDDYAHSIGALRNPQSGNPEVMAARQLMVAHASSHNIQCIDLVYIDFKDDKGLLAEAEHGFQMGYTGKQVIHPKQVDTVQYAFSPKSKQIEWAQNIIAAHDEHQISGSGAFSYNGEMIDMPTIKIAEKLLARAYSCGLLENLNAPNQISSQ